MSNAFTAVKYQYFFAEVLIFHALSTHSDTDAISDVAYKDIK